MILTPIPDHEIIREFSESVSQTNKFCSAGPPYLDGFGLEVSIEFPK